MAGIDHVGRNTGLLQGGVEAFPVDAGTFHHHVFDTEFEQPRHQGPTVALEAAERALVFNMGAVLQFDQHGEDIQHAMHVQRRRCVDKAISCAFSRDYTERYGKPGAMPARKPRAIER